MAEPLYRNFKSLFEDELPGDPGGRSDGHAESQKSGRRSVVIVWACAATGSATAAATDDRREDRGGQKQVKGNPADAA